MDSGTTTGWPGYADGLQQMDRCGWWMVDGGWDECFVALLDCSWDGMNHEWLMGGVQRHAKAGDLSTCGKAKWHGRGTNGRH